MPHKAALQTRFGDSLRAHRRAAGLSQERLAFVSGLHRTEISLLERGARDPRLSTIARLARALDMDAATLLSRSGPPDG
jgi:transcriptional regulator with XRE-family HTH domain